ncbi:ABC transporter ATP-binding protein [Gangjinia marincola]|uniref:ABC transporter ATP-binding protein n=1 Tax=Gangjinia marincola TaxID=578463 RepID=A0ABP3XTF7_9FLAO
MKKNIILKVENLSKQYRLGLVGTGSLKDDLTRLYYRLRGKEDPFSQVGIENDREATSGGDYVLALKDISFEVHQGDVLGIIGRNGAGKSTLLKILSRVTSPTEGFVKCAGRVASLLEVGTGFHNELTGRENIFLNGAILGMTKAEIELKLDEIIEFSGCKLYIDTPVKRYSSGMRVRLAFAVAAHLEPDILIIDEVLAVGDAEFQKKAIGKMQDISKGEGRTVLFVSHNMASVKSLCTRSIVLRNGKVAFEGNVDEGVHFYLSDGNSGGSMTNRFFSDDQNANTAEFSLNKMYLTAEGKELSDPITREDNILVTTIIDKKEPGEINVIVRMKDDSGNYIFSTNQFDDAPQECGIREQTLHLPKYFFNEGTFYFDLLLTRGKNTLFFEPDVLEMVMIQEKRKLGDWMGKSKGILKPKFIWEKKILEKIPE